MDTASPAGAEGVLVVARGADGTVLHGTTNDFNPTRPKFHLSLRGEPGAVSEPAGPRGAGRSVEVTMAAQKAIFFVRSHGGDPKREARYDFDATKGQGRRVSVTFKDGETIAGYTVSYTPGKAGFFLIPADAADNNTRVFVVNAAVKALKWLTAAGEPAKG